MVNEKTNTGLKEGRLQRKMSPSGIYVATFREIILRHGLTMAIISLLCLFVTGAIDIVILGFSSLIAGTFFYLVAMFVILGFFIAFLVFRGQKIGLYSVCLARLFTNYFFFRRIVVSANTTDPVVGYCGNDSSSSVE